MVDRIALQAALLRIFDSKQAVFRMRLLGIWQDDSYKQLAEAGSGDEGDGLDEPELP